MISVVIPVYNEEKIIYDSAQTLISTLSRDFGTEWELILVNDGSTDRTPEIITSLAKDGVIAAGYEKNRGKGNAVKTGVLCSKGDVVLYTDSDLAYGADIIKTFADALKGMQNAAAIGSRRLNGSGYGEYTFIRKLASRCYIAVLHIFAGFGYSDSQCGIKAFGGEQARRIFANVETPGFAFDLEALMLAQKLKMNIIEIPVKIINHRESKINPIKDAFRMLRDLVKIKKSVKNKKI